MITEASSKYRGMLFTLEAASTTLDHFSGPNCPFLASPDVTFASENNTRCTSSSYVISREKKAVTIYSFETFVAIFIANDVLPMLGRAAITTRLPSCKPARVESKSAKCVAKPDKPVP